MIQVYTDIQFMDSRKGFCVMIRCTRARISQFSSSSYSLLLHGLSHFCSASTLDCEYENFSFSSKLFDTFMNWHVCIFYETKWNVCKLYFSKENSIRIASLALTLPSHSCFEFCLVLQNSSMQIQSPGHMKAQRVFSIQKVWSTERKPNWANKFQRISFKFSRRKKNRKETNKEEKENRKRLQKGERKTSL